MKTHTTRFFRIRAIFVVAGAALAVLAGCDRTSTTAEHSGRGAREAGAAGTRAAERGKPGKSGDDASKAAENEAIDFHNNLYGLLAAANKPLEKIARTMSESVVDARGDYTSDTSRWSSLRNFSFGDGFSKIPAYELEAPDAFSSDDREFFGKGIKTVRDSVREIIAISSDLSKYYAAEDYKDDWYKKVYMAAPRIDALIAAIRENSDPLRERADEITEEIDARNVAKIPVGQWVLNMRGFMKKYRDMTACLLREELADPSYGTGITPGQRQARIAVAQEWAGKAESIIAQLDGMAAAQRTLTIADYEGSRYEKIYTAFYAEYDRTKITTRRILRDLREKGSMYDGHNVRNAQSDIGRHLGEFGDLWNEKGSRGK